MILLGVIILVALVLRLRGLGWALPHTYEEARPLHVAFQMWGWDRGGEVTLNPHFFNYPSLLFYVHFGTQGLTYLGLQLAGQIESIVDWQILYLTDPSIIYLAERAVTALFGIASVWAIARLGTLVAGPIAGLLAALFLALNAFHIGSSQRIDVDVPLTFFVIVALWAAVRIAREPVRRDYVVAGIAIGLAASSKYTGFFLLLPLVVAHVLGAGRRRHHALAIAAGIACVTFAFTSPFVLLDFREFWSALSYERSHMAEGHFGVAQTSSWIAYGKALAGRVVSIPVVLAAMAGMGWLAFRRRDRGAIALLVFLLTYLVIVASWRMRADRYLLPVLPVLLVFAAAPMAALLDSKTRLRRVTAVLLILAVGAVDLGRHGRAVAAMHADARTEAANWIDANIPHGAFILTEHYGPDFIAPPLLMQFDPSLRVQVLQRMGGRPVHAVQRLLMFQTQPEESAPFYALALYPCADYVVTSSAVRGRYEREPSRFPEQIRFYERLDSEMRTVQEFAPPSGDGIRLTVYRRPSRSTPFSLRDSIPPPPTLPPKAGSPDRQASFYYDLGANYAFFGFHREAYVSYIRALDRRPGDPRLFMQCAIGAVSALLSTGQTETALMVLERVAAAAPDEDSRARIEAMREQIGVSTP